MIDSVDSKVIVKFTRDDDDYLVMYAFNEDGNCILAVTIDSDADWASIGANLRTWVEYFDMDEG